MDLDSVFGTDGARFLRKQGGLRNPSVQQLLKYYTGTVYAAVNKTANKIRQTKLRLYSTKRNTFKSYGKVLGGSKRKRDLLHKAHSLKSMAMDGGEDVEEVLSHNALAVLRRPNTFWSGGQHIRITQQLLDITSGCYWHMVGAATGDPTASILIPPQLARINRNRYGEITSVKFGKGPSEQDIPPDEVLCFQNNYDLNSPYMGNLGTSPIKSLADELGLNERVVSTLFSIMSNQGMPSAIISPKTNDSDIGESAAEELKLKYRKMVRENAGDILVLDSDIEYFPLQYKPTDLAFVEIIHLIERSVSKAMDIPAMLLRGEQQSSMASYEASMLEWCQGGIAARLDDWEDFLNGMYLPRFSDTENLFFAFDDPSPQMEQAESTRVKTDLEAGWMLINEARAEMGYEARDDGETYKQALPPQTLNFGVSASPVPNGSQEAATPDATLEGVPGALPPTEQDLQTSPSLTLNGSQIASASAIVSQVAQGQLPRDSGLGQLQVLLNLTPDQAETIMGSVGVSFFAPSAKPQDQEPTPPTEDQDEPADGKSKKLILPYASLSADAPAARSKAVIKPDIPEGKQLEKILQTHFAKWEKSVLSKLSKAVDQITTKGLPKEFIPSEAWSRDLARDSQPGLELGFRKSGKDHLTALIQRVGASPDVLNVFNPLAKKWAEKASLNLAQSTLDTTSQTINAALQSTRQAIADGMEQGDGIRQITNRVKEIFDSASTSRAKLIATTETARAFIEGHRESAILSDVVKGFEHLTTSDPCDICQGLQGHKYKLNDVLPPENTHPGCLCVILDVLGEPE